MSDKTNDLFTSQKDNKGDQQGDPRVEKLLRRQMSSQVNDFLKNTSIKPEYHKVLRNHVVNTIDPSEDVSEDEIKGAIKEFISDNGWTKEMLVGSESQSQTPKPPAGKPSAANTKTRRSRKSDSSEDNSEDEINDPDEFKNMLRSEIMNAL